MARPFLKASYVLSECLLKESLLEHLLRHGAYRGFVLGDSPQVNAERYSDGKPLKKDFTLLSTVLLNVKAEKNMVFPNHDFKCNLADVLL